MTATARHRPAHSRSGSRHGSGARGSRRRRSRDLSLTGLRNLLLSPEARDVLLVITLVGAAGAAMVVTDAAPTRLDVVDKLWAGGLAATVAYFAGYARRWTWFLPAGAGALLAADNLALACGAIAIILGFLSVWRDMRSRPFAAAVAGLGTAALLHTEPVGFHGANSLLAAAMILPVLVSGYRLASRPARRFMRRIAGWVVVAVALILAGGAVGVLMVAGDLTKGARLIDQGIMAARDTDSDEVQEHMGEASRYLHTAEATLTSWFVQPAHGLPVVGPNIRAVSEMARDTAAATTASEAAATVADLDNLRFEGGRLEPDRIEHMISPLREVAASAETTQETVSEIGSPWLVDPLQSRLNEISTELDHNLPDLEQALEAVEIAGPLIGGEGDRRYLVLFTTPVESRGRTGFPGNYAELTFIDGKLDMPEFGRIGDLEEAGDPEARRITGHEEYLARYGRFEPAATWRNIGMSPDFPTVADVAMQLYPQSGARPEVDGVLAIDPAGLAALMHFTGPVELPGLDGPLTAENVEDFLHLEQYIAYEERTPERADFLGEVAEEVFERLTEIDLPSPSELVDVLGEASAANHIQFTTRYEAEAEYFNGLGIDGAMPGPAGDTLAVTTTNVGPNKIDAFLNRRLAYDVTWDPEAGRVDATVTATFRNQAPASGLPEYLIGNRAGLPWGYNRSYVSIYSSWTLDQARIDGEPVQIHPERELERYAYSTYVDIPPGGEVVVELDLSGEWLAPYYPLIIAPAPLVSDEQLSVEMSVAGEGPLIGAASNDQWEMEGRTARFEGPLNERQRFAAAPPELEDQLDGQDMVLLDGEPPQP